MKLLLIEIQNMADSLRKDLDFEKKRMAHNTLVFNDWCELFDFEYAEIKKLLQDV